MRKTCEGLAGRGADVLHYNFKERRRPYVYKRHVLFPILCMPYAPSTPGLPPAEKTSSAWPVSNRKNARSRHRQPCTPLPACTTARRAERSRSHCKMVIQNRLLYAGRSTQAQGNHKIGLTRPSAAEVPPDQTRSRRSAEPRPLHSQSNCRVCGTSAPQPWRAASKTAKPAG